MTVLLVSLVVLLIAMFIARASGNSLSIFGFRIFRVSTGSMEPTLMVGDVIVVQKTSPEEIHKGDIITFKPQEGLMAGSTVTHRVVLEPTERNGRWYLQTQGDADGATLDPKITDEQVVGKYVRTLPLVSKIYSFFLTPMGLIAMIVVILALFGYELISLIVSYKSFDKTYDQYLETQAESGGNDTEENPPDEA